MNFSKFTTVCITCFWYNCILHSCGVILFVCIGCGKSLLRSFVNKWVYKSLFYLYIYGLTLAFLFYGQIFQLSSLYEYLYIAMMWCLRIFGVEYIHYTIYIYVAMTVQYIYIYITAYQSLYCTFYDKNKQMRYTILLIENGVKLYSIYKLYYQ